MTERESDALGWSVLTSVLTLFALVGGIAMGIMLECNILTDMKLRERTIECVTHPTTKMQNSF